ncbi:MAG TPA: toll/interleukin-1 receptor domain-containing protein [Steroidobacteraceae bacterium]|nr:toll/interleukin-1 receptor domain-containing protein [Steroidobacteraceae bacterium]
MAEHRPSRKVKTRSKSLDDPLLRVDEYGYDGPISPAPDDGPDYGPVLIKRGVHKGRIGAFDNQEGAKAFVYFGHPLFAVGYHLIPVRNLSSVSTVDLVRRHDEIYDTIGVKARASGRDWRPHPEQRIELLAELAFIQNETAERLFSAQFSTVKSGSRIFISHSSIDKPFARLLAMDLATKGHRPWLDEWKILAGESIPSVLSEGLDGCDFVVVLLSEHAVKSKWVEREWQAKYWDEVNSGKLHVIPALLEHCTIPTLLRYRKYADFTQEYNQGLDALLLSVKLLRSRPKKRITL